MSSLEIQEIDLAMDLFLIASAEPIEDDASPIIIRNQFEDLMKSKKYKHLTYDQKLYNYNYSKEGKKAN